MNENEKLNEKVTQEDELLAADFVSNAQFYPDDMTVDFCEPPKGQNDAEAQKTEGQANEDEQEKAAVKDEEDSTNVADAESGEQANEAAPEKASEEAETGQAEVQEENKDDKQEDDTPEKTDETKDEPQVEQEEEGKVEEVVEEVTEPVDEEKEKIKAELAELRAKEEDRNNIENLHKTKQEAILAYERVCNDLQAQVEAQFKRFGIDPTKTLADIQKEEPAKAAIAQQICQDALKVKEAVEKKVEERVQEAFAQATFTKAERLFAKYQMTPEQEAVAADTFMDILFEAGINNLDTDLEAKIRLSVGAAKMAHPDKVEVQVKETDSTQNDEVKKVEVQQEQNDDMQQVQVAEAEKEKMQAKIREDAVNEFAEGATVEGAVVNNAPTVTVDNVLTLLEQTPFREQAAFYNKYTALINEAMRTKRLKAANIEDDDE